MNPDMVTRLRAIADGGLSQKHCVTRVTRVTHPTPADLQEDLLLRSDRKQGAVARVTRVTRVTHTDIVAGYDSRRAERVTVRAEPQLFEPGLTDEFEERAAVAQYEAGFPAEFALAFAHLQMSCPEGVDEQHWQTAVDAMGRVLDQCRERAQTQSKA